MYVLNECMCEDSNDGAFVLWCKKQQQKTGTKMVATEYLYILAASMSWPPVCRMFDQYIFGQGVIVNVTLM